MKKMLLLVLVLFLGALVGGPAQATTIDFEDLGLYSKHTSIAYAGVTFTEIYTGIPAPTLYVDSTTAPPVPLPVGPPLSGNVIVGENKGHSGEAYKAAFSIAGVRSVSVDIGDISSLAAGSQQDVDNLFLNAYDASDVLLAFTYATLLDENWGLTLWVSTSANIAYVTFGTDDPNPGSVYFDNFTFVPLPGAVWLLGSGLLGLAGWRRFKKS